MVKRGLITLGRLLRERLEDSDGWEQVHRRNYPYDCGADFWRGYNSAVHRLVVDLGDLHGSEVDDPGRIGPEEATLDRHAVPDRRVSHEGAPEGCVSRRAHARRGGRDRRQDRHEPGHGRQPDDVLENGNGE